MGNIFTDEQYEIMEDYLDEMGYGSIVGWALDSHYVELREPYATPGGWRYTSEWQDEHGNPVDLWERLWHAIEAAHQHP